MTDFITIGSATMDVFVESDSALIVSVFSKSQKQDLMAFPYGSKCEVKEFKALVGGGGINTAANFAHLGFNTSTIVKIGDDFQSTAIIKKIKESNINIENIIHAKNEKSGFSIILISFQGDRTVLANRGANATISSSEIDFNSIKKSKWLYIAPLNGQTANILDDIADFAEKNDVNMAINVGTTSIKQGSEKLSKVLKTAEVVIMNKEEAALLTKINVRPDNTQEKFSQDIIHPDIIRILNEIKNYGAKTVVLTDGKNGAYAFDGEKYYQCPQYPAQVVSTLGAGDNFASTFVASIQNFGWNIEKALQFASVNASCVVSNFGAQEGFLTFDEIEQKLKKLPLNVNIIE